LGLAPKVKYILLTLRPFAYFSKVLARPSETPPNLRFPFPAAHSLPPRCLLLNTLSVPVKAVLVQDQFRRPALAVGYKSDLGVDIL